MLAPEDIVRKLSKSNKYQTLYSHFKENGCSIFRNSSDYTQLQISFLNFLNFYHTLYMDIALGYVTELVLENDVFEDAYFYYKSKKKMKLYDEKEKPKGKNNKETISTGSFTWVMKNKPKS